MCTLETLMIKFKVVKVSLLNDAARVESLTVLSRFRTNLYDCLSARADALFELTDALPCADGAVKSLVDLTLTPEHRRGHGALYGALNRGRIEESRLRAVLADLPVQLLGRVRSDRVLLLPKPSRLPGAHGRPPKHGPAFALDKPATWPEPQHTTTTDTTRYGTATPSSWDRLHPRLTHRACWIDHEGDLPVIEGTLIRLQVEHLPGDRDPKPMWLWSSATDATDADIDRYWQSFLRRFDLEHTFRLFKQTLGWTRPKIRTPQAADRWTWLIVAAYAQLRLARPLADDLRRPWEKPALPGRLTPARVRRGFRNLRAKVALPASAPKPGRPGPGRPPGSKNRGPAPHYDVGKTVKRDLTMTARRQRTG